MINVVSNLVRTLPVHLTVLLVLASCGFGPTRLSADYSAYNEAVRRSMDEQLLLNLIRIRYQQTPVFLRITSVTSSYSASANFGASLTQPLSNGSSNTTSIGGSITEQPTISYSLPESEAFFGKMLAPLGADQLAFLSQYGSPEVIFQLGVRRVNGLANAQNTGRGIVKPKSYTSFRETLSLMRLLIESGKIDLSFGSIPVPVSAPIAVLDGKGIAEAIKSDIEFVRNKDGQYVATAFRKVMYLRFTPASDSDLDSDRLRTLLKLTPDRYNFEFMNAMDTRAEKSRMRGTEIAAALDPTAVFNEIALENRSMTEVLYFAAQTIVVPENHIMDGIVLPASDPLNGAITIMNSLVEPVNASVRVQYEGYWFFIRNDDQRSKWTLFLLNNLLSSTAGSVPGAQPVLTLPVR